VRLGVRLDDQLFHILKHLGRIQADPLHELAAEARHDHRIDAEAHERRQAITLKQADSRAKLMASDIASSYAERFLTQVAPIGMLSQPS
jgi:hypothetical protein